MDKQYSIASLVRLEHVDATQQLVVVGNHAVVWKGYRHNAVEMTVDVCRQQPVDSVLQWFSPTAEVIDEHFRVASAHDDAVALQVIGNTQWSKAKDERLVDVSFINDVWRIELVVPDRCRLAATRDQHQ